MAIDVNYCRLVIDVKIDCLALEKPKEMSAQKLWNVSSLYERIMVYSISQK